MALTQIANGDSGLTARTLINACFTQVDTNVTDIAARLAKAGGTLTGQLIQSTAGAASTPPLLLNGTIFTGGSATTTKPQFLIEPAGTTSTAWKTAGTMLGVNAPTGFTGDLFTVQRAASLKVRIDYVGNIQWDAADNIVSIGRHGTGVQFCADGAFTSKLTSTELRLTSAQACVWTDGSAYAGATVTSLRQSTGASVGSPCLQIGADAASGGVINQHLKACNGISSASVAGADLTLSGGNGRGGAGGDLILASYTTEASEAPGTLTTRWTLDAASGALIPGADSAYDIGSTALNAASIFAAGFYVGINKVVGAQGAAVSDASGGAVVDAEARTAINDLLARIRTHGLIAT